jgi:opacity protein-like surface antigen
VTVELAYRYIDLGDATTGNGHSFNNLLTFAPFEFQHLTSSDVRLGLRFNCCDVPPPPPPPLHSRG